MAEWEGEDSGSALIAVRRHFRDNVKEKSGVAKPCHKDKVYTLAWNSTGTRLASGSQDRTGGIYTLRGGRLSKDLDLRGHTDGVMKVCWNPTSEFTLASASRDKSIRIWDHRGAGKCVNTVATEAENIGMAWSPDGNMIAVGNEEDVVEVFDTRQWKRVLTRSFNYEVNEMGWSSSSSLLFLTNGLGNIDILNASTLADAAPSLPAHTGNCVCIQFDPSYRYFSTGGTDALYSLWDAAELVCVRTFTHQESSVRSLSFSSDGQLLAVASDDTYMDISHVETGESVHRIALGNDCGLCVAWHPKQLLLAFACDERNAEGGPRTSGDIGQISIFGMTEK